MNRSLFSSKSSEWETPQDFFNNYNAEYGGFDIDVCATKENAKCKRFFTLKQDGLKQEWKGKCWMNPPYGREIAKWVRKAYFEAQKGNTIVALLPARTDTSWFHNYIYMTVGVQIFFLKGRLKFNGHKNSAPFPSMIVEFKKNPFQFNQPEGK